MSNIDKQSLSTNNSSSNKKNKVLLVDSSSLVRTALRMLVDTLEGYQVVGESSSLGDTVEKCAELKPDIVLFEICLNEASGIEMLHEMRRLKIETIPVVLSSHSDVDIVAQSLLAGARGYVLKQSSVEELQEALDSVTQTNRRYVPKEIADCLNNNEILEKKSTDAKEYNDPLQGITKREREIFHLLASGLTNAAIAKRLFISPRTVETHRARIVRKLNLHSNGDLIRFAIRRGLSVL